MGWQNGYYYRVRKINGRVVKEYIGTGRVAELAAGLDRDERAERERCSAPPIGRTKPSWNAWPPPSRSSTTWLTCWARRRTVGRRLSPAQPRGMEKAA